MKKITALDEAQLTHEFREMYKDIGELACFQVVYELVTSASLLLNVIDQEHIKSKKDN